MPSVQGWARFVKDHGAGWDLVVDTASSGFHDLGEITGRRCSTTRREGRRSGGILADPFPIPGDALIIPEITALWPRSSQGGKC